MSVKIFFLLFAESCLESILEVKCKKKKGGEAVLQAAVVVNALSFPAIKVTQKLKTLLGLSSLLSTLPPFRSVKGQIFS